MVIELFGSLIILIYIFFNSYIIGIEIIILVLLLYFIINYYNPKVKKINEEIKKDNDKYTSIVQESINGIREVKTLGIKKNIFNEVKEIITILFKKKK